MQVGEVGVTMGDRGEFLEEGLFGGRGIGGLGGLFGVGTGG